LALESGSVLDLDLGLAPDLASVPDLAQDQDPE
jgi:hypothetical protein